MTLYVDTLHFLILRDYDDFLEDLEEDKIYRQNVNIYKGKDSLSYIFLEYTRVHDEAQKKPKLVLFYADRANEVNKGFIIRLCYVGICSDIVEKTIQETFSLPQTLIRIY